MNRIDINKSVFNRAVKDYRAQFSTRFDDYLSTRNTKYYTDQKKGIVEVSKLEKQKADIQAQLSGITTSTEETAALQNTLDEIDGRIDIYEGLLIEESKKSAVTRDIWALRKPYMSSTSQLLAKNVDSLEREVISLQDNIYTNATQTKVLGESYKTVIKENKELNDIILGFEQQNKTDITKKPLDKKYVSPAQRLFYEEFIPYMKSKGDIYKSRYEPIAPTFDIPAGVISKYAEDPQRLPISIDGKQVRITPFTEWLGSFFTGENEQDTSKFKELNQGFGTEQEFMDWINELGKNEGLSLDGRYTK
jgi:hypothetical protein